MDLHRAAVQTLRVVVMLSALGAGGRRGCCGTTCGESEPRSSGCAAVPPCGDRFEPCCGLDGSAPFCRGDTRCADGQCVPPVVCGAAGQACCGAGSSPCGEGMYCADGLCRGCGSGGQLCCPEGPPCAAGARCVGASCVSCGGPRQPCCEHGCRDQARCIDGVCSECGARDRGCCPDQTCREGLLCTDTSIGRACQPCGGFDQPCCPGDVCQSWLRCLPGQRCLPEQCGAPGAPCCGGQCGAGTACVPAAVVGALDAGPRDATADAASPDVEASHDATLSDAEVQRDADVPDAPDAPRVCMPCGAADQPCCPWQSCEGELVVCDPLAREGAPMCRRCGVAGAPCCPVQDWCRDGSRCARGEAEVSRCVHDDAGGAPDIAPTD